MNRPATPPTLRPGGGTPAGAPAGAPPGDPAGAPRRVRPPAVARIAGWSARNRKTAVLGWLLLVAAAVLTSSMLGTKNLNSNDPGQAGRAERVLDRPDVVQRPAESVLIQERTTGRTLRTDPQLRQATRDVV